MKPQHRKLLQRLRLLFPSTLQREVRVERNDGVAFLPRMCVEDEIRIGLLHEVTVREMQMERKIRLVYPARRALSHAAQAFLELVGG